MTLAGHRMVAVSCRGQSPSHKRRHQCHGHGMSSFCFALRCVTGHHMSLTGVCLLFVLPPGEVVSKEVAQAADAITGTADKAATRASDAAGDAKHSAQDTAQRAGDSARDTADRAQHSAKDAAQRTGDSLRDAASRAGDKTREAAGAAQDTASRAGDGLRDTAHRAGEVLQEGVDAVAEGPGYAAGAGAERLSEAQEAAARAGEKGECLRQLCCGPSLSKLCAVVVAHIKVALALVMAGSMLCSCRHQLTTFLDGCAMQLQCQTAQLCHSCAIRFGAGTDEPVACVTSLLPMCAQLVPLLAACCPVWVMLPRACWGPCWGPLSGREPSTSPQQPSQVRHMDRGAGVLSSFVHCCGCRHCL